MALIKGMNSITMELKVAITLRLLAGASYLHMIWSVHPMFNFTLQLMNKAHPDNVIFNFQPELMNGVKLLLKGRDST